MNAGFPLGKQGKHSSLLTVLEIRKQKGLRSRGQEAHPAFLTLGASLPPSKGVSGQIKRQAFPSRTLTYQEPLGQGSSTSTSELFPQKLGSRVGESQVLFLSVLSIPANSTHFIAETGAGCSRGSTYSAVH